MMKILTQLLLLPYVHVEHGKSIR